MLTIRNFQAGYGRNTVLKNIDLDVPSGQITVLVGANGAGKTTLLRSLSAVHKNCSGTIQLDGRDISRHDAAQRVALGISQVPEGRQMFASLSVLVNLVLGATVHLHRSFDPVAVLRCIQADRITTCHFAPIMVRTIIDVPDFKGYDKRSVRSIQYASAPMAVALLREAIAAFGSIFTQVYGMTECIVGTL
ncbi:MAG: ATP-binding cassette domain-containing protein, partial [Burkholderiaceae bacterium]|nr:ATP-binding cassette domain-containing protein [Burkholderiaceae bacterium]